MDWNGKRVLVTGGTGFIGSFIVERLLAMGAQVRVPLRAKNYRSLSARRGEVEWLEGDLREEDFCARLLDRVDHLFHLASCRRNVAYHHAHAAEVAMQNLHMTLALAAHAAVPVTFFSTALAPDSVDMHRLLSQAELDGYGLGKALCEAVWIATAKERNFPLLVARPVGVYGPRDTFADDANVIPSLMVRADKAADALAVWGDGSTERAFLYVEDLVEALFRLLDADVTGLTSITSADVTTVGALAQKIRDLVKPDLPIAFDPSKPGGSPMVAAQNHPALANMSWTSLDEGLGKTYRWWKEREA